MSGVVTNGGMVVRHSIWNFLGQAAPLLVGVLVFPAIVRGLGPERFGLLSLAWVVLGYFSLFDLGLARATTKHVADALGTGDTGRVPRIIWSAAVAQGAFGLLGAVAVVAIAPSFVPAILSMPPGLVEEARGTLRVVGFTIPVVVLSGSLLGALEGAQRFGLANAVRISVSTAHFVLPLVGVIAGLQLPGIMTLIALSKVVALLGLIALGVRVFPELRCSGPSLELMPRLFSFGGWVMVTAVVSPLLVYLDRFLVASKLSMAALAFYVVPWEVVTRLLIIPVSLATTLFPVFSGLSAVGEQGRLEAVLARSVKITLLALTPIVLALLVFAGPILHVWLGSDFAEQGAIVMQILAIGVLINSLAHFPYVVLLGAGRPEIPARLQLVELVVYAGLAWVLVSHWGITGAATAWTLRVAADALVLFAAAFRVCSLSAQGMMGQELVRAALGVLLLAGVAGSAVTLGEALSLVGRVALFFALLAMAAAMAWRLALDESERAGLVSARRPWS